MNMTLIYILQKKDILTLIFIFYIKKVIFIKRQSTV